jgi:hypothetical protein
MALMNTSAHIGFPRAKSSRAGDCHRPILSQLPGRYREHARWPGELNVTDITIGGCQPLPGEPP